LPKYDGNNQVVAIAGSRAMAIASAKMSMPALRLFQLTSAGFDYVPLQEYRDKGVAVANAGSIYSRPIAETVVFGMLLMAKKLRKNPNNRHFKWTRGYTEIVELGTKKVLIMGAGNIGTAVADRLQGFEMQIDGYDPYCVLKQQYQNIWRTREELLACVGDYDYIVSTMPDNEQTRGFIDAEIFAKMKQTAVIINVGRKAVFNQKDFYNALKKKVIGGAVLDMFEKIPNPITNKFRRLSNVVVLPGVAAISQEVNVRLKEYMYQNISAVLDNKPIINVINGVK
jgi:phosphoglycerate dehydrogenase-like enzyme